MNKKDFNKSPFSILVISFCIMFFIFSTCAFSDDDSWKDNVPDSLKPWIAWVSKDIKINKCPRSSSNYETMFCDFITSLKINLEGDKISFTQNVFLYEDSFVKLMGDKSMLPKNVKEGDENLPIIYKGTYPYVFLKKGAHEIKGIVDIENNSTEITLPEKVAIIQFRKDGNKEDNISIINNKLQLAIKNEMVQNDQEETQDEFNDSLDIQVRRILEDDVPFKVTTLLRINASGKERDENFGKIIFPNSRIFNITSALPVRFDKDNNFIFKVRRGSYEIKIDSILNDIPQKLLFFKSTKAFPDKEIWGYTINNVLRTTQISGVRNVAPINFGYPISDSSMRVYEINENESFNILEKDRAPVIDAKNELTINRNFWLNFKGDGYFVSDSLSGNVKKEGIMIVNKDFHIAKANVNNVDVPLFIDKDTSNTGINLHQGSVKIESEGRYSNINEFTLTPYSFTKNKSTLTLHLPSQWKIFNISNIKNDYYSWVSKWNLLRLFYLCLTFCIIVKVFSLKLGIVSLISMILVHNTEVSLYLPLILITFFHFISTLLYNNEKKRFYFNLFNRIKNIIIILLLIFVLPFVIDDVRRSVYPQLGFDISKENQTNYYTNNMKRKSYSINGNQMVGASNRALSKSFGSQAMYDVDTVTEEAEVLGVNVPREEVLIKNSSLAIPTGFGKPMWNGSTIVKINEDIKDSNQKIKITYLTPTMNLIISFLRAIFLGWLFILLINFTTYTKVREFILNKFPKIVTCLMLCFVGLLSFNVNSANADFPSEAQLNELREYVKANVDKAPNCAPTCASISSGDLKVSDKSASITLKLNVISDSAFPIIKNSQDYVIDEILVDNDSIKRAIKTTDNNIWVFLYKGIHDVKIKFTLQNLNMPNFVFEKPISKLNVNLSGYEYLGQSTFVKDFKLRRVKSLTESAIENDNKQNETKLNLELSSYYFIEKELIFNDTEYKLITKISKFGNTDTASTLELKLTKNEKVLTSNIDVKNDVARIDFAKGDSYKTIESRLPIVDYIELKSQDIDFVFESWKVFQSESWQVSYKGIPEIINNNVRYWVPRKKETLFISISAIKNADAPVETITRSEINYLLAEKELSAEMKFVIRSSQGGKHEFIFPKEFKLESCYINYNKVPCTSETQDSLKVNLELIPSEQTVKLMFKAPLNWKTRYVLPKINTNIESVNSIIKAKFEKNNAKRFLLWARGPKMGACVLFWVTFPIIIIFAAILKYVLKSSISFKEWFILLLGCSLLQSYVDSFLLIVWLISGDFVMRKRLSVVNEIVNSDVNNSEGNLSVSCGKKNRNSGIKVYLFFGILAIFGFCNLIRIALLGVTPNMWIAGNGSYMNLTSTLLVWYEDIVGNILPMPEIYSVSIIYYKVFIVFWALWGALFIIKYLTKIIKKLVSI
ncbi:MAG: hypothetical protein SPJ04_08080 [Bdellovibrionota bacterium]|nr:hypothetical protein [Bdellovibrionota bacterium]